MDEDDPRMRKAKAQVAKMRSFYTNLTTYVIVNLILLGLNLLLNPRHLWFFWVAIFWGIAIVVQAINTFTIRNTLLGDDWEEKQIQKILDKEKKSRK